MSRPLRRQQIQLDVTSRYHITSRCVRKMRLTDDPARKDFMLGWLKRLHEVFAVEVCRYALMGNHFHLILRINPKMAAGWSDREVVRRWAQLHPPRDGRKRMRDELLESWIEVQTHRPEFVAAIRARLADMGQFMKDFKQRVAEVFNKADEAVGAFWQGRYTCVPLEGEAQLLACMAYVDLNPHAARLCDKPEDDPHTSLHESVQSRDKEAQIRRKLRLPATEKLPAQALRLGQRAAEIKHGHDGLKNPQKIAIVPDAERHGWTVPVGTTSTHSRQGLFSNLRLEDYLRLVDFVAKKLRDGKAQLDAATADILERLQTPANDWLAEIARWLGGRFATA